LTTLPPLCAIVLKSRSLILLEPSRPVQACNGIAYSYVHNLMAVLRKRQDFFQVSSTVPYDDMSSDCFLLLQVIFPRSRPCLFFSFLQILGRPSKQHLLGLRSSNVTFSGLHIKNACVPGEVYAYGLSSVFQRHIYP